MKFHCNWMHFLACVIPLITLKYSSNCNFYILGLLMSKQEYNSIPPVGCACHGLREPKRRVSGLSITQIKKQKIYLKARNKSNISLCLFCSLGYYYSDISYMTEMIKLMIDSKTSTAERINDTIQRNETYIKKVHFLLCYSTGFYKFT